MTAMECYISLLDREEVAGAEVIQVHRVNHSQVRENMTDLARLNGQPSYLLDKPLQLLGLLRTGARYTGGPHRHVTLQSPFRDRDLGDYFTSAPVKMTEIELVSIKSTKCRNVHEQMEGGEGRDTW